MKLVQKLTFALILGMTAVLAGNGVLRVRREVALFQSDRIRDHKLVGLALGAAFVAVWRSDGAAQARSMLEQVNAREDKLRLRWVERSAPPGDGETPSPPVDEAVTRIERDADGQAWRRTIVPVALDRSSAGMLELSESLVSERSYVRTTILDTALTTALLALGCAALSAGLGAFFVGRPMASLIDKARRVGRGDFSAPLLLAQRDELAELAREMNTMCERLVEANAQVAREVSERIATIEQLRHADRLMTIGKLASGVAHELGTPLNVVSARAGMIADGETTAEESTVFARVIVESCEQMTRIIRQLLDFARPHQPDRAPEDVRQIARRSMALLAPIAAKKGVALALVDGDASPVVARVDAGQLQQVFTNILVNAIQAMTAKGTIAVTVSRERAALPSERGDSERAAVCVRVRDEGRGIAPEHLPHVFEPFFTTKDIGQGTGLGLSVAHGIVREHGGCMAVRSALGQGSEFSVVLPEQPEEEAG